MKTSLILLGLLLVSVTAFYDGTGDVVKLTADNIKEELHESDDFWLVEFFAPWCGHCKKLTPEWERAAKGLKGMVKMGAVDMTTDADAGEGIDVEGYPTLKWFGEDKSQPEEFDGGRTSTGIINFAAKKLKEIANARIGNKKRPKKEKAEEKKEEEAQDDGSEDDVVVLTDDNFAELVEESSDAWFVEFYAPWCGHCKTLMPVWKKLATAMKGQVKVAKVDATVNSGLGQRFGVKGYPSLKFFPGGAKSDSLVEEYNGGRDLDALTQFAETQSALSLPAKFQQLSGQESYDEYCTNNKGVCIIVFLPSLYESSAEQRNAYISQIEEVANATKGKPFTFLWSEGGQQYEYEESFQVGGSGFPAVLAVTVKKSKYAVLMQSFGAENLQAFITKIGSGKQVFSDFKNTPAIKTVAEWDGKDKPKSDEL